MKKLLFATLLFSCPLFSMEVDTSPETSPNHANRLYHRQTGAVVLAREFTARRRLFVIGDTAEAEETHAYRTSSARGNPVVVTTNMADNVHPTTIRCNRDSEMIYSDDHKYLLLSSSDRNYPTLKVVRIFNVTDNKEVYSYCPNFSSIADMRFEQDELGIYILTVSGRDFATGQVRRVVCEIPLESIDHRIRESIYDMESLHI